MKNTLAISVKAAAAVFMSIASSDVSPVIKGRLMQLAGLMMERPDKVNTDDFETLPGGAEIYATIALAVKRSQRARAAAARRAARLNPERQALDGELTASPAKSERASVSRSVSPSPSIRTETETHPRPSRHPRLKVRCRYVTRGSRSRKDGRKSSPAPWKSPAVNSHPSKAVT